MKQMKVKINDNACGNWNKNSQFKVKFIITDTKLYVSVLALSI